MRKSVLYVFIFLLLISFAFKASALTTVFVPVSQYLGQGSRGGEVVALQNFLIHAGYLSDVADGKFGPKTKSAVIKYQKAKSIKGTGFVGRLTLTELAKDINNLNNPNTGEAQTGKKLSIKTDSVLPKAKVGQYYSVSIEAEGGTEGYKWEMTSGSLPSGLGMKHTFIQCVMAPCHNWFPSGIFGTPEVAGQYAFTITVTSGSEKYEKNFTLDVLE